MNRTDSNEITKEYFDRILLKMCLIDAVEPSTVYTFFGHGFATPIMTAALSHLGPENMKAMMEGAADFGAVAWYGMGSDEELEDLAATGAKIVKIIKPYRDESLIFHKIEHAKRCGVVALGMDIDHAFDQSGNPDVVEGTEMEPKSAAQLASYVRAAQLPFIIKGVMSEEDAVKARDIGAAGILLSHHNGRIPCSAAPLMLLPAIRRAVGSEMKIFVDCQISGGVEAFKALALGADAVCVGKALIPAIVKEGSAGVKEAFEKMNAELKHLMAYTGYSTVADIDSRCIYLDK